MTRASSIRKPTASSLPTNGPTNGLARDFWENELELSIDGALRRLENPEEMRNWIASRTGRQLNVLCRALWLTGVTRIKDKRAALVSCDGQLASFYLADHFARRKAKFGVADLATTLLPREVIDLCRGKDDETFDTKALLYALLHASPEHFKTLFHLDKIHKSGFARMTLKQKVRQPDTPFEKFLTPKRAAQILKDFDRQKRDRRESQFKNIVRHHHHHLVFIRRPEREQYILREGRIHHGHRVEWIILDFADNARRVNISSESNDVPLQIANALASAYFGKDVEYDNECQITYEKQIHNLLDALKAGTCEGLRLVDLEPQCSAVHGVDLRLSHDDPDVMQRAIAALERDYGSLTVHIDRIVKLKVVHLGKRIDVKFEKLDSGPEEYIVRYMDHRLNATVRKRFEDFMRDTHGIPILSTEKRFAREHATALLEDGARIERPSDALLAAAQRLREQGLIDFSIREFVNCSEPRDRDFPPRNRHCQGRILLEEGQDEDGDEIRCPKCERPVRPYSLDKLRHRVLQTTVRQAGAIGWIHRRLEQLSADVRDLGGGAFHVGGYGDLGVIVCVVDADGRADSRFNTRDYAATNPICYITINPRAPEGRFLKDEWIRRVALADLVAGDADLRRTLAGLVSSPRPTSVCKADIPVYAKGHVLIQPEEQPHPQRVFNIELCDDVVRIEGEIVVNPQAGPRLKLFRILWKQFVEDMSKCLSPDDFAALSMRRLLKLMEDKGHRYDDETSLRKVINNLQTDIETAVKRKLGKPISREDIVQTCRMTSQSDTSAGYRLNPFSVAIRPPQPG